MKMNILYKWANSIFTLFMGKQIFIFAETEEEIKKLQKKINVSSSTTIKTFTDTKKILAELNAHPIKYSEGYIGENSQKKSTTKILTIFLRQSSPRLKLQTFQTR